MRAGLDRIAVLACADLSAAEVAFRRIANDDPNGCFVPHISEKIRTGAYKLCEVQVDDKRAGFTCYYVEDFGGHKEFVSVATMVFRSPFAVRFHLDVVLDQLASREGCKTVRMHTCRHGLVSQALARGWHVGEVVLRRAVGVTAQVPAAIAASH